MYFLFFYFVVVFFSFFNLSPFTKIEIKHPWELCFTFSSFESISATGFGVSWVTSAEIKSSALLGNGSGA